MGVIRMHRNLAAAMIWSVAATRQPAYILKVQRDVPIMTLGAQATKLSARKINATRGLWEQEALAMMQPTARAAT